MLILFRYAIYTTLIFLVGCSNPSDAAKKAAEQEKKSTLVNVTTVKKVPVEVTETAVGSLESLSDPILAAETSARVIKVHVNVGEVVRKGQLIASLDAGDFNMQRNEAQAEVARIKVLLENQAKTVARNQTLVDKKFISQNAVDNDTAQQNSLKQQLEAAKSRVGTINHASSKTKLFAPTAGTIEKKIVDSGDYVRVGDPIVQIVSKQKLRAHLPFPEHIGAQLKAGLTVRLTTPSSDKTLSTVIHELKPMISEDSRTLDVIADIENASDWQPGASVTGTVVLTTQSAALMIPEESLVLRPAGEVVYTVRNNVAYQTIVKTGIRQNGLVEILSGVTANEQIVVDGAGFLTDKTPVKINR